MTRGQLFAATTARELSEWEALYRLEYEEESDRELRRGLAARAQAKLAEKRKH
jgi:hypothetical protein